VRQWIPESSTNTKVLFGCYVHLLRERVFVCRSNNIPFAFYKTHNITLHQAIYYNDDDDDVQLATHSFESIIQLFGQNCVCMIVD